MSPLQRRRRRAGWVTLAFFVLAVVGYLFAAQVRSPRQEAADAAPVARTVLTVPAAWRVLSAPVVFRATLHSGAQVPLTEAPVVSGADPVVTRVAVRAGGTVRAGGLLIAVAGSPVIALPGQLPSYRDLHVQDTGPDVIQLQQALHSIGLYRGSVDGHLGPATVAALRQLWVKDGYALPAGSGAGGAASAAGTPGAVVVTKGSIVYLPTLPATIFSVSVQRGAVLTGGSWAAVRAGAASVSGRVPGTAGTAHIGQRVRLYDDTSGASAVTSITGLGLRAASGGVTATLAVPAGVSLSGGQDALRAVLVSSTAGRPVLAVPVVAIHANQSGSPFVVVLRDGRQMDVEVSAGASADGWVGVTPASEDSLAPGTAVVVGE